MTVLLLSRSFKSLHVAIPLVFFFLFSLFEVCLIMLLFVSLDSRVKETETRTTENPQPNHGCHVTSASFYCAKSLNLGMCLFL